MYSVQHPPPVNNKFLGCHLVQCYIVRRSIATLNGHQGTRPTLFNQVEHSTTDYAAEMLKTGGLVTTVCKFLKLKPTQGMVKQIQKNDEQPVMLRGSLVPWSSSSIKLSSVAA